MELCWGKEFYLKRSGRGPDYLPKMFSFTFRLWLDPIDDLFRAHSLLIMRPPTGYENRYHSRNQRHRSPSMPSQKVCKISEATCNTQEPVYISQGFTFSGLGVSQIFTVFHA